MRVSGGCHCGNLRLVLDWPERAGAMAARACGCSFCTRHGAVWTGHPDASLVVTMGDPERVSAYRFGTGTADFRVCARCGIAVLASGVIEGRTYAVVNVNTFENFEPASLQRTPADFEGEGTAERLERRKRHWIPRVRFTGR